MLEQLLRFRELSIGAIWTPPRRVPCYANIIGRELYAAAEKGYWTVTFPSAADRKAFWEKYKQTESAYFCF